MIWTSVAVLFCVHFFTFLVQPAAKKLARKKAAERPKTIIDMEKMILKRTIFIMPSCLSADLSADHVYGSSVSHA